MAWEQNQIDREESYEKEQEHKKISDMGVIVLQIAIFWSKLIQSKPHITGSVFNFWMLSMWFQRGRFLFGPGLPVLAIFVWWYW